MLDLDFAQAYARGYHAGMTKAPQSNPYNCVRERDEFHGYNLGFDKATRELNPAS